MQGPEAALREVIDVTDQVRARGLNLLKLLEVANDVGPREGPGSGSGSGGGPTATPEARQAHVLGLLQEHEKEVRTLLKTLHERVAEVEQRENKNKKPNQDGEELNDLDTYESSEASRSIAIKGVSRDIAHSLQNEIAWRDAASKAANEADAFFHERLATLFPDVEVGRRRRQLKKRARRRKTNAAKRQSGLQKGGKAQSLNNGIGNGTGSHPVGGTASAATESLPSLTQVVKGLPGLADFHAEHGGRRWKPLKKLTLTWRNGLRTTLHFGPARKRAEPGAPSQNAAPSQVPAAHSSFSAPNGAGADDLYLDGVRLVWVSADSQYTFVDTTRLAEANANSSAFASEMAAQAQQKHFMWLREHSEVEATHKLLRWLAARVQSGPESFPR
ncbi:Hypothetical Protein FCC1311_055082 [Hondaea fermentalgiana]|uniref:Uncharacterized protein n=1 Tax=Hondaea fermentalgiana TaxID=2315210 RepID=A0A2R5GEE2_9STRA|nr:Hypothetical Protein FCC1311_055082 [Hondaea fermentalgiana]|eukprot:GBG29286.1 Hypothetical Protein FCC1311_055082 [Hondaea fermentalgiana]